MSAAVAKRQVVTPSRELDHAFVDADRDDVAWEDNAHNLVKIGTANRVLQEVVRFQKPALGVFVDLVEIRLSVLCLAISIHICLGARVRARSLVTRDLMHTHR